MDRTPTPEPARSPERAPRPDRRGATACRVLAGILVAGGLALSVAPVDAFSLLDPYGWDGPGLGRAALTFHLGWADPVMPLGAGVVSLTAGTPDLPEDLQARALRTALDAWAGVAAVSFSEAPAAGLAGSIDFAFGPTRGLLPELANARLPWFPEPEAGDIFFNDDYQWEVGDARRLDAFDLTLVAAHEIGHALGLGHSDVVGAVMFPFVSPDEVYTALDPDDVVAIRTLYAANVVAVPEAPTLVLVAAGLLVLTLGRRPGARGAAAVRRRSPLAPPPRSAVWSVARPARGRREGWGMNRALLWAGAVLAALIAHQALARVFGAQASQWMGVALIVVLLLSAPALLCASRAGAGPTGLAWWRAALRRALTHPRT